MTEDLAAYETLLDKARASLPDNVHHKERWQRPSADVIKEGRSTILRNFAEIVKAFRRDEAHVSKFLFSQIGIAGNIDGDRLVFLGPVKEDQLEDRLSDYVGTYVQCSECGAPDTHLERDGRIQLLKCEACGAHKPIKARKARRPEPAIKEGETYDFVIKNVSKRGDGVAIYEGFTIFVPRGQPGQQLKVRINRINGKIAFGEVV